MKRTQKCVRFSFFENEGVETIQLAGESFTSIVGAVSRMQDEINKVCAVTGKLSASTEEVVSAVENVSNVLQQINLKAYHIG